MKIGSLKKIIIFFKIYLLLSFSSLATTLNIISTPETSVVISEILVEYAKLGHSSINASFSQSTDLLDQIQDGLAVDMVITSHSDWISEMKQKGLIDITSISNLFVDKLVIVSNIDQDEYNDLDLDELIHNIVGMNVLVLPWARLKGESDAGGWGFGPVSVLSSHVL